MVTYRNDNGVLEVRHRHEVIRVQAWGADSVRVRAAQHRIPGGSAGALGDAPRRHLSGNPVPAPAGARIELSGTGAALTNGRLRVEVTFDTSASYPEPLLCFRDHDGGELLKESREHFWMPGARVFTRQPVRGLRDPPAVRGLPG